MAEFQEVMRQLNRLCSAHENCYDEDNCPMQAMGCCGSIGNHCSEPLQAKRIEKTVMQWAAEHPELVYPTWGEWLELEHIVNPIPTVLYETGQLTINQDESNQYLLKAYYYNSPIPDDIAKKLGLEPKKKKE